MDQETREQAFFDEIETARKERLVYWDQDSGQDIHGLLEKIAQRFHWDDVGNNPNNPARSDINNWDLAKKTLYSWACANIPESRTLSSYVGEALQSLARRWGEKREEAHKFYPFDMKNPQDTDWEIAQHNLAELIVKPLSLNYLNYFCSWALPIKE